MDTGLDQNEAELAVLVLAVALEVLADSNGLETLSTTYTLDASMPLKHVMGGLPS